MSPIFAQEMTYQDCKIKLKNDTLSVENTKIKQIFYWNKGQLVPIEFQDKTSGHNTYFTTQKQTDFRLNYAESKSDNDDISISVKRLTPLDPEYLSAAVTYHLTGIKVKRVIDIFPNTASITHSFYLKGQLKPSSKNSRENTELGMIESNDHEDDAEPFMARFQLENPHWQFEVISFKEATDYHNTLTHSYNILAYKKAEKVSGNFLLATNPLKKLGFYIIKESPIGKSQSNYPNLDFKLSNKEVSIMGLGIPETNTFETEWTKGYGYTIGLGTSEKDELLFKAKTYQKQKRAMLKDRDEMILANTWGDRSKDSRMNEAFILQEIKAAAVLGITHLQLDDGWQQGLSKNSASKTGQQWDDWQRQDWLPHKERFPNGFKNIAHAAKNNGIELCLWFNPSKKNAYASWERDADILIDYHQKFGINVFKIDGIELADKTSEINLRKFFDKVQKSTKGQVVFNLDVTAGRRMGYFYFMEYGNLFMENRYTDWANYYPHSTLRNLWMLSKYIPAEKIQVEFLNKWRNEQKYGENDVLAPTNIPFEYLVAGTFAGQPLAWMELSGLPEQAFEIEPLLKTYKNIQHEFHKGVIMPIGEEPNGLNWSGFQSVGKIKGYFLIYRAHNDANKFNFKTFGLSKDATVKFKFVAGEGKSFTTKAGQNGEIEFSLENKNSFGLIEYTILEE